jgi:hypothetical protein
MQVGSHTYQIAAAKLETGHSRFEVLFCYLLYLMMKFHLVVVFLFAMYPGLLDDDDRALLLPMSWRLELKWWR